jgi:hypothetical protein
MKKWLNALPGANPGILWMTLPQSSNDEVRRGYESESASSEGILTAVADEQSAKNNEL